MDVNTEDDLTLSNQCSKSKIEIARLGIILSTQLYVMLFVFVQFNVGINFA